MPNRPPIFRPRNAPAPVTQNTKRTDPFYNSPAWRHLRAHVKATRPLCGSCQRAGRVTVGTVCDHIKPRRLFPALELDPSNLEMACDPCHNAKRGRERHGKS